MALANLFKRDKSKQFEEIEEYRDLLEAPETFEDGFNTKTIIGALFVSILMVPGNIYLELMIGGSIGAAAQWVTIILFLEIAKRSFTRLRRQEIYLLYYVTTSLVNRESGAFEGLLWHQYFVQSPAAKQFGISKLIPWWYAPPPDSEALVERTFFHQDWFWPITLLVLGMVMGRIAWFSASYVLFRLTSDYEKLPFPFAPINAQGAMALAEESTGEYTWKWRVFSTGAVIGVVWGLVYVAVPAISGAFMERPVQLIPIPFVDFTQYTGYFLEATPIGFTFHLGPIFAGLLAPFWAVAGSFLGVVVHTIASPILYRYGFLPNWMMGMDTIQTHFVTGIDFWMSFGIGITFAVTVIGFYQVWMGVRQATIEKSAARSFDPPPGRGDFRIWVCIIFFCISSLYTIVVARILFPHLISNTLLVFFFIFAFVYTPLISFVNARLDGLVGQNVNVPYIKEATIFLSGFQGIEIWFVDFGIDNYGASAERFRQIELTGTRFSSILRAEVFMVPLVLATSFMYWSYIWKLAPIPSDAYPYVQRFWPLRALQRSVWVTGTMRSEITMDAERRQVTWTPSNLPDQSWWYWRVRASADIDLEPKERTFGPWSQTKVFYTGFDSADEPLHPRSSLPDRMIDLSEALTRGLPSAPEILGPYQDAHVDSPNPSMTVAEAFDQEGRKLVYQFEVDKVPSFDGSFLQSSDDRPILFDALKPKIIGVGFVVGIGMFIFMSVFGLPILMVFGYIQSLTQIPHLLVTQIIGALLARFYFWKKYGKQEWRRYAAVLVVGFSVGMALVGMASVSIAMIQKSVSVLLF
ncbi:OPT/YSL family transporter [bacterium]|nr:OPT/YSL family transporter [bacterium]